MYKIRKGTDAKLITLKPNVDAKVEAWVTRKDLTFRDCLISPIVVQEMVKSVRESLAGQLATQGYALFGGDSGGDRQSQFVLAVPYEDIEIT